MLLNVYSIFDIKAKVYGNPFYMSHNGEAQRAFGDLVKDQQSTVSKHPEDYQLFKLATFDNVSGKFTPINPVEFMAHATDYLPNEKS